jgi:hypothetical protein
LYFQYILKLFLRTTSKELERTELAQGHPKNYFAGPWGQVKLRRVLAEMVQKLILNMEMEGQRANEVEGREAE